MEVSITIISASTAKSLVPRQQVVTSVALLGMKKRLQLTESNGRSLGQVIHNQYVSGNLNLYTLSSATGRGQVKYMATPFFDFYMTTGHVL